jgi:class 3 adenylate cyclase
MPFYMDRHDLRDVTAENMAAAHQQDLKLQSRHKCRALTYWFDEHRQTAFCLFEAPNEAAVQSLHREAHGLLPTSIIEVQPDAVASFLGRVSDPHEAAERPIREAGFRAIRFSDMADSTRTFNALGDAEAHAVLTQHHDIVRRALLAHEGREVDRTGDGFFTCFAATTQAVACAIAIQRGFRDYNASSPPARIRVRIGLGAGEPLAEGSALFGSTVNLTARICAFALPDQILASRVVRELCRGEPFRFQRHDEVALKGFPEPVELHAVDWAG